MQTPKRMDGNVVTQYPHRKLDTLLILGLFGSFTGGNHVQRDYERE